MRIIHFLVGNANPETANGVNKVVHWLCTMQVAAGHQAEVWGLSDNPAPAKHEHNYVIRMFKRSKTRFLLDADLKQSLRALPASTWIHLHSIFVPELTSIALFAKHCGLSYGTTPHGGYLTLATEPKRSRRWMKQLFRIIWENSMLRSASFIHAVGETEVGDLREQAPETPVVVIPNGFSWGSLELGELGVSEPSGKIAYCGRLRNPQKGLDLLIEGFAIYRRNGGMMTLVMIGDGLDREGLVALAQRLGVNEVIEWKGLIFGPELRRELRQCEAFVHTSRFDVFPTACLEAAALGLPLIVSVETNLAELLRKWNAGWSYSPNTPDRIASVLATVENAGFQERRICGKNAAEMIRNDLSWQSISTAFTTQVEKALAVRSVRTAAQV